jgi:DNA-binding transcriptional LysR family regulator
MNINHLRIFRTLASTLSMVHTAHQHHIKTSTVSQAIARLEDELGVTLIDRSTRPIRLTRAGILVDQKAEAIFDIIHDLQNEMTDQDIAAKGEIRIGMIDGLESFVMPAIIGHLNEIWPDRTLLTRTGRSDHLLDDIKEQRLDISISGHTSEMIDGINHHELISEPLVAVIPKNMNASGMRPDLSLIPMIKFNTDFPLGRLIDAQMKRCRLSPRILASVDSTQSMISLCKDLKAWGVTTPLSILDTPKAIEELDIIPTPFPLITRTISIWHREGELATTVNHIRRIAKTVIRQKIATLPLPGGMPIKTDHLFPNTYDIQ